MDRFHDPVDRGRRGAVLSVIPFFLVIATALVGVSLSISARSLGDAHRDRRRLMAEYAARAGLERQLADLAAFTRLATLTSPFAGIDALNDRILYTREDFTSDGAPTGEYSVRTDVAVPGNDRRYVTVTATGWYPDATDPRAERRTVRAVAEVALSTARVFDYAYFINNWGWFYGGSITANGSVASNGQFDCGNTSPTVNGSPRYTESDAGTLSGYLDDNGDGIMDGTDGGIYAGWDIVGTAGLNGMGANPVNQHDFQDPIPMPNLTDLTLYEQNAIANGSNITIAGVEVCDGVLGDEAGEHQHLYLKGTATDPIVLNGPVVVRGSVAIEGYVTGKGAIFAGDNVYIVKNVQYLNPPSPLRPADLSEAGTEAWIASNTGKDALGLFAREHVVIGNYTSSTWQSSVNSWMNSSLNKSKEDSGEDGIPNTKAGRDGILGTADDDLLEEDGTFTVDRYTAEHALLGQIPAGMNIGDPIPGSGEDIDGDGVYDPTVTLSEFAIPAALNSGQWGGNPPAVASFGSASTLNINRVDAAIYTNHAIAGRLSTGAVGILFFGCMVSRNESIIYSAPSFQVSHDARLCGGGENFGFLLPKTFAPLAVLSFESDAPPVEFGVAITGTQN